MDSSILVIKPKRKFDCSRATESSAETHLDRCLQSPHTYRFAHFRFGSAAVQLYSTPSVPSVYHGFYEYNIIKCAEHLRAAFHPHLITTIPFGRAREGPSPERSTAESQEPNWLFVGVRWSLESVVGEGALNHLSFICSSTSYGTILPLLLQVD